MVYKITGKITSYKVLDKNNIADIPAVPEVTKERMHEGIKREKVLEGKTYKIKTPLDDHAMYITINDHVLNKGTEFESRVPFEVFINSKNMENFQWVLALTRLISATWRKGGETKFLIDELKSVFDPRGGYFKGKGKFMPSIVAEIGYVIENHLNSLEVVKETIKEESLDSQEPLEPLEPTDSYPEQATLCTKCSTKAVVILDGCQTCLSCGDSKCS